MSGKVAAAGLAAFVLLGLAAPGVASSADLGCDEIRTGTDLPFTRQFGVSSTVTGSLADSAAAAGVPAAAMAEVVRALGTAIDLDRDVRNGDRFHLRYEESFTLADEPTGNARVLCIASAPATATSGSGWPAARPRRRPRSRCRSIS
jgi:hypothetical protein